MFANHNYRKNPRDRFIPLRIPVDLDFNPNGSDPEEMLDFKSDNSQFINRAKIRHQRENYRKLLADALLPLNSRVLHFNLPKQNSPKNLMMNTVWPVARCRKKPLIEPPEKILDLPNFDANHSHHTADWSSKNCLATIYLNEVHVCLSDFTSKEVSSTNNKVQNFARWNEDGTKLVMSLYPHKIAIWYLDTNVYNQTMCCCLCQVRCAEWLNHDFIVTACDAGFLTLYSPNLKEIQKVEIKSIVLKIVASINRNYIGLIHTEKKVSIWKMPEMKKMKQIDFKNTVQSIAWHPWKTTLLAIAHSDEIIFWDFSSEKKVTNSKFLYKFYHIDALTFNPISGELVVSHFIPGQLGGDQGINVIAVLTNTDSVMEELLFHTAQTPYLLWGNGGKYLATASADECLCIWNFFGTSKQKLNEKLKNYKTVDDFIRNSFSYNVIR